MLLRDQSMWAHIFIFNHMNSNQILCVYVRNSINFMLVIRTNPDDSLPIESNFNGKILEMILYACNIKILLRFHKLVYVTVVQIKFDSHTIHAFYYKR